MIHTAVFLLYAIDDLFGNFEYFIPLQYAFTCDAANALDRGSQQTTIIFQLFQCLNCGFATWEFFKHGWMVGGISKWFRSKLPMYDY